MSNNPIILFSKPVTCRTNVIPDNFCCFFNEAEASRKYKKVYYETYKAIIKNLKNCNAKNKVIIAGRFSELFFLRQGVMKYNNTPSILLDIEWHWRYRNKLNLKNILNRNHHRLIAQGSTFLTVFCEEERRTYSEAYGIPLTKILWHPFCSDVDESVNSVNHERGKYLFTGGLHDRDYHTLFNAIRDTPIKLRVAAPEAHFNNIKLPDNVTILGTISYKQYLDEIEGSIGVVLSLDSTSETCSLRCPGVITYLTAMRMRKCVIVNELLGAASYITNGKHGILVEPNNVEQLNNAILTVWNNYKYRQILADNAYVHSHLNFGYDRYFNDLNKFSEMAINKVI